MTPRRYWWLAVVLFGAMALRTINQYWAGDFLEHAASSGSWRDIHGIPGILYSRLTRPIRSSRRMPSASR
jgi:hypothetical protein